jgi:hypothetical protein
VHVIVAGSMEKTSLREREELQSIEASQSTTGHHPARLQARGESGDPTILLPIGPSPIMYSPPEPSMFVFGNSQDLV